MYLITQAPNKTEGMEKGTNQKKICHLICFLKTAIRDTELVKVPIVKEKGTTELGINRLRTGIKIRLAPPPQIALIQNARIVPKNKSAILNIIFKF